MCMVSTNHMEDSQTSVERMGAFAAAACSTEDLLAGSCHSQPTNQTDGVDAMESEHRSWHPMQSLVESFSDADLSLQGQKRSRDEESHSSLPPSPTNKRARVAGRRVQFAEESKMKLIPRISELEMEADAAAAVEAEAPASGMEEEVEVLACGVVEEGSMTTFVVPQKDEDEILVKTKEDDGPSTENVATQALVVGLIERKLSGASAVVDHLRSTIRKTVVNTESEEQQPAGVCDQDQHAAPEPCGPPSSPKNCKPAKSEQEMFDLVVSRMQLLIDRIESRGRATLLPSTAQIGPPFVPALKFLQRAIRSCAPKNPPPAAVAATPAMVHA